MKISGLLKDKNSWCQYTDARDYNGNPVSSNSERAVAWCLLGCIHKCYNGDISIIDVVVEYLRKQNYTSILAWNDKNGRTFEEVRQLVVDLDI